MESRSTRFTTATEGVALAALTVLLTTVATSSFAADDRPPRTADEIADRVAAEQAANGPYSEELIDLLGSLGLLYEEDGLYALSAAMRERAMQVVRANYGLRSFDQAPFLVQRIATEEARGNFTDAWALEQSLLALVAANPDDLRTVPVLRDIAAKRMTAAERYAAGEFPPQIMLGCYYNPSRNPELGSCSAGSKSTALGALLADARRHYRTAIDVLVRQGQATSDEVRGLEMVIVRDSYRYGTYGPGRYALHRLFDYDAASSAPLLTIADAALRVADWDLAFGQHPVALDIYEHVYRQLVARAVHPKDIERRFGSPVPILVPTSERNPFDPANASHGGAYIDVAFEITKYGRGKRPRILDATSDVSEADVEAVHELILNGRFRPAILDGEFVTRSVTARRYIAVEAPEPRRRATLLRP
jgi:hypothetical protein